MLREWHDRLRRNLLMTRGLVALGRALTSAKPDDDWSVADLIEKQARERPDAEAVRFEGRVMTYRQLDAEANRVAHWAHRLGIGRGDVVALLMENRPEYLATWIGLAKLGAVTALLNTNLAGKALAHCLEVSGAKHLVVGVELGEALASALPLLTSPPRIWARGGALPDAEDLDAALELRSAGRVDPALRQGLRSGDDLFYIYTSGTTGLPKAARFSHLRFRVVAGGAAAVTGLRSDDRFYVVLPLYHTAGGVMAAGSALVAGACIVLARRFSARRFFPECAEQGVTAFQYIGELCRYLLHTPPNPADRAHRIRVCIGNGLRPDIWVAFQQRFALPRIIEFYGATEGNVAFMNLDGKVGAIGRMPAFLRRTMGIHLVRFDVEHEQVMRDERGRCIECAPGEIGEAVGRITATSRFEGYTSHEATERKILRDVFEPGDAFFRTGDLMRSDAEGYFYFVDRIGDTFRWKGENVSTSEVAEVLSVFEGVKEANVYGVAVPGQDGRAGMAALVAGPELDLAGLARHVTSELPSYARPLFLRLRPEMEVTGTFKHRKIDLVSEGFDPASVRDALYRLDAESGSYQPFDAAEHARLLAGGVRV